MYLKYYNRCSTTQNGQQAQTKFSWPQGDRLLGGGALQRQWRSFPAWRWGRRRLYHKGAQPWVLCNIPSKPHEKRLPRYHSASSPSPMKQTPICANSSHLKHRCLASGFFFQLTFPSTLLDQLPHCLTDIKCPAALVLAVDIEGNFGVCEGNLGKFSFVLWHMEKENVSFRNVLPRGAVTVHPVSASSSSGFLTFQPIRPLGVRPPRRRLHLHYQRRCCSRRRFRLRCHSHCRRC